MVIPDRKSCSAILGALALTLVLAGCGSARPKPAPKLIDLQRVAAASVSHYLIAGFGARGRFALLSVHCPAQIHAAASCTADYDFTGTADGIRREIQLDAPVACSRTSCRTEPNSPAAHTHIVRVIGLDPRSHVGRCAAAIKKGIATSFQVPLAQNPAVVSACKDVHHSIYSGPGSG